MMGDGGGGVNGVVNGVMVAAFELANGDHHIQLADAETNERSSLLAQGGD